MAFEARHLLLLQDEIFREASQFSKLRDTPLLWCLSHRGEEWQVWAGFIEDLNNEDRSFVCGLYRYESSTFPSN
jgi:hypothetical protein